MWYKIILNIFLIAFGIIFQLSFVSNFPFPLNHINIFLLGVIFVLAAYNFELAMIWGISSGWLLDVYSFEIFGVYLITLFFCVLFINFILNNFFTNRSLYSFLAMVFFSTLFFQLFLLGISYTINYHSEDVANGFSYTNFGAALFANLFATIIVFYLFNVFSIRLRPEYLKKTNR
jgi:rod shape-determining protein MreD